LRRRAALPLVFAALLVVLTTARVGRLAYEGTGPAPQTIDVVVPEGGSGVIADALMQAHVIESPLVFRVAVFLTRGQGPLHAGEFLIPAGASLRQVLDILRHGSPVQHQLTIPEGLTSAQITKILDGAAVATGNAPLPAQGAVLPQTYDYLWGTPRAKILARAEDAMQSQLAAAWAQRAPGLPLASPAEALTLASIVQAETPLPAELPSIAAVYENRLNKGMKLQADPTVIFAQTGGAQTGGAAISRTDLASASPYNTYAHAGLPPGPICAPGLAAITAVLHPANIPSLYFVATGNGGHVFTTDFSDHLKNVAAYHAALKSAHEKGDHKRVP
jgi:UPF0755 protein